MSIVDGKRVRAFMRIERRSRNNIRGRGTIVVSRNNFSRCMKPFNGIVSGIDVNPSVIGFSVVEKSNHGLIVIGVWEEQVHDPVSTSLHVVKFLREKNVSEIFLEDPGVIKEASKRFRKSFYRLQKLIYTYAIRHGINVWFVDPDGTSSSIVSKKLQKEYGVPRHGASSILIALRGLGMF